MLDISYATIKKTYMAWVGNKGRYEGVKLPTMTLKADVVVDEMLLTSMLKPYHKKSQNFYLSETDERGNDVKMVVSKIFEQDNEGDGIHRYATVLSNLLYEVMEISKANGGEFIVALFDEIVFEGEPVRALGLWKVNSQSNFIIPSIMAGSSSFMDVVHAIDINKTELSALILNIEEDEGYRVLVVDTLTKPGERSMWKDEFLRLKPLEDDYYFTSHRMAATHEYVVDKMKKYSLTRPERISLLVKIGDYFHDNEEFEEGDFLHQIFPEDDDRGEQYLDFIQQYGKAYAVSMNSAFTIDSLAKKENAKLFRVSLKLDKNFNLAVKSSRQDLLERGIDQETGKQFYKVYYDEEA